ncbi:MAG: hypothetical protein ACPGLV_08895 [Bacteroidia bacterium]
MKEVTVRIPDEKYGFFLELIESLGLENVINEIPEFQKEIVRKRIAASKPENLKTWDEARESFKV